MNDRCNKCGCHNATGLQLCEPCREKEAAERWAKLPKVKWDGEGMIYSEVYSEFFADVDSLDEWIIDHGLIESYDDLRLVICEPAYAHPLRSDSWQDDLSDDDELVPDWLEDAIEAFNEAVKDQPPLSYQPGNMAVDTSGWELPKEDADA